MKLAFCQQLKISYRRQIYVNMEKIGGPINAPSLSILDFHQQIIYHLIYPSSILSEQIIINFNLVSPLFLIPVTIQKCLVFIF